MRQFQLMMLLLCMLGGLSVGARGLPVSAQAANPIVLENQQPGTDTWRLRRPGFSVANDTDKQIKGYASATSVNKGQPLTFYVTVNPAQSFKLELYRMGWYGGMGGRLMHSSGQLAGSSQAPCVPHATTGRIECNWNPSYSLTIPTTWTSGVYLGLLTNSNNFQNYIIFVVRDDERPADFLYQQSITTFQAYNNYPNDGATGKSLYDNSSFGNNTIVGSKRAVEVSFDRPYRDSGAEDFLSADWSWEYYFIRWAERSGYDMTYSTDLDTHTNGARLLNYAGFLSVGHDEYWSDEMYDAAEVARDAGIDLAFFGSNDVYWQVRFAASSSGTPNRVMICYKDAVKDPEPNPALKTARFREVGRAEQQLIGIMYDTWADPSLNSDMVVINSDHWLYAGSGAQNGDRIPRITGYEIDRLMTEFPAPINTQHTLLAHSPYVDNAGRTTYANSSIYRAPSGAWVFGAGTMSWSWALDRDGYTDSRIQQATHNLLARFLLEEEPDPTPTPTATPTFTPPQIIQKRVSTSSEDAEELVSNGAVTRNSTDLEFGQDGSPSAQQVVGMRFSGLAVPRGATILSARVQFTVDEPDSGATSLLFTGQASDNAPAFAVTTNNLSSRPRTAASVSWSNVPAWPTIGQVQSSPELSAIVQEIVNRPGWRSGNGLALLVTGTGERTAVAFDSAAASAPLLQIEFSVGVPSPTATATLSPTLVASSTPTATATSTPTATATITATATRTPSATVTATATITATATRTPSATATATISATATRTPSATATATQATVTPQTVMMRVSGSRDDAEEMVGNGEVTRTSTDLEFGQDGSPSAQQLVGMRFIGVGIPNGATIRSAYLEWTVDEPDSIATSLLFQGEASPNPAPFSVTVGNLSSRPRGAASVSWPSVPAWTVVGQVQRSPDLSAIVQETVSRAGWRSGNALALFVSGNGERTAASFEAGAAIAPLLVVEYILNQNPQPSTPTPTPMPTHTATVPPVTEDQTVSLRVSGSRDDAEEMVGSGEVARTSTDLEFGEDGSPSAQQLVGMRFVGVGIPNRATIRSAYLEWTVDEPDSIATSLLFQGEANPNPAAFSVTAGNLSSRPRGAASVSWPNVPPWTVVGQVQRSPDLSAIVQEAVNRAGWRSGNALVLFVSGSGERTAAAFEAGAATAPLLVIEYAPAP